MVSFRMTVLALASAVAVSAELYTIDPESVPLSLREAWCRDELSVCPLICQQTPPGTTLDNTCDPEILSYSCVCGNGLQPNITEYSLTLPYHICQQWGVNCQKNCGADNECASSCVEDHPCGAQSPKKANTTISSTMSAASSSATATGPVVFDGLDGNTKPTSNPSGNAASPAIQAGGLYGLVVVTASLFAGFALVL